LRALTKFALLGLAWACAQNQSGWGNPAILKELRLAADDVASVSIYLDRCQRESRSFPAARTADLLSMLGSLPPAPGVGVQEAWEVWLLITIETHGSGSFEVSIGTRRSLDGVPIAILSQDTKPARIGFYAASELRGWLESVGEVAELMGGTNPRCD
jgi:hypothetical protein